MFGGSRLFLWLMLAVGVKFPSQQWALGLARSPAMTKRENGTKRLPAQSR